MKNFFEFIKVIVNKYLRAFAVISVLIIATFFRVVSLDKNPAGFFCDEASKGYDAYQIWNTGSDQYGRPFPLFFQSFGDYKNPVYIYSVAPIVGIFGLNQVTVRLTSVIYGLLSILAIFLYVREISNFKTGIISALFLAISPWHIHFSRVGFAIICSVFWVTISLYFLEKSLKNIYFYPLAAISFIFSFFSYSTPKIYLLPLLLLFFLTHFSFFLKIIRKPLFWSTSLISIMLTFMLIWPNLIDGTFFARWTQVVEKPQTSIEIYTGYINHFSLDFLFRLGDIDFPGEFINRHSVRGVGQLYWFQLPLIISFLLLVLKKRQLSTIFIFCLFLIYPFGTIFTQTNPSASRSIIGVIPFQIASAFGLINLFRVFDKIKFKYIATTCFVVIIFFSVFRFIELQKNYPLYSSDFWGWQYGAKPVIEYFLENYQYYDRLCLEGVFNAPEIFIKFYDPQNICQNKCQICDYSPDNTFSKQLFAISNEKYQKTLEEYSDTEIIVKKKIYYPDNSTAFVILEFK